MNRKSYIEEDDDLNGLNPRHVAQINRRKMLTKVKPSAKKQKVKNKNWKDEE
jgi:hypothetical protein